ncbi:MAG: VIT domain-containing protein [Fluviicoccus sp.]|uniref:VIT domain-containing protein n=1 Tax=Fluviicoccus sp. TaxID=2003552 RepID=UPI002720B0D5|nr:VIT domain-containing protein [Fluviicoccus sp.]MDO8331391.1 VIT domain-containing protein [Fluviicoccus sp.]
MTSKPLKRALYATLTLSALSMAFAQTRPDISVLPQPRAAAAPAADAKLIKMAPGTEMLPMPGKLRPQLVAAGAHAPIVLERVMVRGEVAGHAAYTRIEMTFRNPNPQVLEGELQFPLYDGQSVAGFALDINGELRDAVPVDKAKGQQVFEDTIRRRVDPALLEVTQGNNYKLRVYPLPANGTRRVVLEIVETLPVQRGQALYRLPLQFSGALPDVEVRLQVAGRSVQQVHGLDAAAGLQLSSSEGVINAVLTPGKLVSDREFTVALDETTSGRPVVATQYFNQQTYFYAEVPVADGEAVLPRSVPRRIGLVWDASGSGEQRNHARELAMLEQLFRRWSNTEVQLVLARDTAEHAGTFSIRNGDWSALRQALGRVVYDGATSAEALSAPAGTALNLLVGDGLVNYGGGKLAESRAPLFAVSAAVSNNNTALRQLAEKSGGALLDLTRLSAEEAVAAVAGQRLRLAGWSGEGVGQVTALSRHPESGLLTLAGVLNGATGRLQLDLVQADGQHRTVDVPLTNNAEGALAATRWAVLQLADLQADPEGNREAIRNLGRRFNLVTPETSLIVLDQVWDYVNHEITPPESLMAEYRQLMANRVKSQQQERRSHLENVVSRFEDKVRWWERDFSRQPKPLAKRKAEMNDAMAAPAMGRMNAPMQVQEQMAGAARSERRGARNLAASPAPAAMAPSAEMDELMDLRDKGDSSPVAGRITLTPWQPDAPYTRTLRTANPADVYGLYLQARPEWRNSTAFYLDVADILLSKGKPELALRVLSNLAEMNLENRHILRVLAYRLQQAGQPLLAIPVLQKVLALAPNEPQSWRDLGLAQAAAGQPQQAVDSLWQVVSRPWNGRFPDVEQIALAEMNAILATSPKHLNTSGMDPRLLRNLPVAMRVTLAWDADNTDIDLHVTDALGEEAYYGNPLTGQGGRMSADFTGGFGPEEFSLKKAAAGKYVVHTNYFGDRSQTVSNGTTLQVRLSTNFGTRQQKDEYLTVRLTQPSDRVEIGEVVIGK